MSNSIEKNIQRIKRFSITCTLNDNGTTRYFHNGHEFVEIGGIKWATCNVGAEKPTDNGLYFAWGETKGFTVEQVRNAEKRFNWDDYKYGTLAKYNTSDKKTVLEPLDDAATFNMGVGWRTPTREEYKTLFDSTTSKFVADYQGSGINGRLFTDKKDSSKTLFFPSAGICGNSSIYYVGSDGYYWSSSLNSSDVSIARYLFFYYGGVNWVYNYGRYYGLTVRGVVDK